MESLVLSQAFKGCTLKAVSFDFETHRKTSIPPEQAAQAIANGGCVWLDIDLGDVPDDERLAEAIGTLGLLDAEAIKDAIAFDPPTQQARHASGLHFALCGCRIEEEGLVFEPLNTFVGRKLVVTLHRGAVHFLETLSREYHEDFSEYAQTLGFMVYELWDHLIENFQSIQQHLEGRVLKLQGTLLGEIDDVTLENTSRLGADLLRFRALLVPARSALGELSTRKSVFIPMSSQPFLRDMLPSLEHLLQDVMVARDILSDSLNLSMSMTTHRTSRMLTSLTSVSIIFLPLTFLCGVYGMNFLNLPELQWRYGYPLFWGICGVITLTGAYLLRRNKML